MVTCRLYGRLGNQMMIIANCVAYSLRHGHEYHIPAQSQDERLWPAHFKHLANPRYSRFADTIVLKEKSHAYQELNYDPAWADSNILLDGFFQSEKYFEDYIDEVREAFNLGYKRAEGFVGIHIRRGDYLRFPDKHPPVTEKYIMDAVSYFVDYGYKSFVVCSDDMAWTRSACDRIDVPGVVFSYSDNRKAIDDFVMLHCCDHHIISNSSFSLAAHILCPYEDKFCIAPKVWFGPGNSNLPDYDIYPKNCVKL